MFDDNPTIRSTGKIKSFKDNSNFFIKYLAYSALKFSTVCPNLVLQKAWLASCQALVKRKHFRNNQSTLS